jgi:acyl-coenzyme A synthetase/AMP-(fatty) acid ligase
VIVVVPVDGAVLDVDDVAKAMQHEIRTHLNPLFKIADVAIRPTLPRTASAKVMRRALRSEYGG